MPEKPKFDIILNLINDIQGAGENGVLLETSKPVCLRIGRSVKDEGLDNNRYNVQIDLPVMIQSFHRQMADIIVDTEKVEIDFRLFVLTATREGNGVRLVFTQKQQES